MPNVSVIIPCADYHDGMVGRALASCEAQTAPCRTLVQRDPVGYGAGWARNKALRRAVTPLVLFLDADDELAPDAVETMLAAYEAQPSRYVYSDWQSGGQVYAAPDEAFVLPEPRVHLVSALMPTGWALQLGGFDTSLPYFEDTDFYLKLRYLGGWQGQRVARPLVTYAVHGERSAQAFVGDGLLSAAALKVRQSIYTRYTWAWEPARQ